MLNVQQTTQLASVPGVGNAIASIFGPPSIISADGAVPVVAGVYVVTKAGVAALTIAAPAAADVGTRITLSSATANAHVLTFTGNTLRGGTAAVATATFAAQIGAGITIECVSVGVWNVLANVACTLA